MSKIKKTITHEKEPLYICKLVQNIARTLDVKSILNVAETSGYNMHLANIKQPIKVEMPYQAEPVQMYF